MRLILVMLFAAGFGSGAQKTIERVKSMPDAPSPYKMRDWNKVARDYDAFVYNFDAKGPHLPLIRWDRHPNYNGQSFAMVSYVGNPLAKHPGEGINVIASIVGATLAGIDKSHQSGHNFVAMAQKWFDVDGERIFLNTPGRRTGGTFWYEIFPNVLAFELDALYPETENIPRQVLSAADQYYAVSVGLGGKKDPWSIPDFTHLSFSLRTMKPTDNGRWKEPDAAAGVAFMEYMAYLKTKDPKYLTATDWALEYLMSRRTSPLYEILLPYGAYTAARMNAEQGRKYDVGKLITGVSMGMRNSVAGGG